MNMYINLYNTRRGGSAGGNSIRLACERLGV